MTVPPTHSPAPKPSDEPLTSGLSGSPRRRGPLVAGLLTFAACLAPSLWSQPANVLLIAVDDLRPELGCYGHDQIRSPHIDQLAREGTLFERAYCQQALCAPSRASFLTGLRPTTTGIVGLTQPVRKTVPDVRTLPEHFRRAGYETVSLGKIYHHGDDDNRVGWSRPAWMPPNPWTQAVDPANGPLEPGGRPTTWECVEADDTAYPDGQIAQRAIEELATLQESGKPFFLAVGFLKPHLPFFAPKKYWDLYSAEDIQLPTQETWPAGMPELAGSNWEELRNYRGIPKQGPLDEALARRLIHGYYACVSYVDAMVGKLLQELERRGLRENTIVVFWGDHGFKLADYGAWCKHTNLELDLHSPLIVSAPGQATRGRATSALVEFVDVYPTLTELCGLETPGHLEGTSFAPLLTDPTQPWKEGAFSVYPRGRHVMGHSVRDARWRYTEWRDSTTDTVVARELYDHATQPTAAANRIDDPALRAVQDNLEQLLDGGRGWQRLQRRAAVANAE